MSVPTKEWHPSKEPAFDLTLMDLYLAFFLFGWMSQQAIPYQKNQRSWQAKCTSLDHHMVPDQQAKKEKT